MPAVTKNSEKNHRGENPQRDVRGQRQAEKETSVSDVPESGSILAGARAKVSAEAPCQEELGGGGKTISLTYYKGKKGFGGSLVYTPLEERPETGLYCRAPNEFCTEKSRTIKIEKKTKEWKEKERRDPRTIETKRKRREARHLDTRNGILKEVGRGGKKIKGGNCERCD